MYRRLLTVSNYGIKNQILGLFDTCRPYKDGMDLDKNDVLLLEGGTDVGVNYYGQNQGQYTSHPDRARDQHEKNAFVAIQAAGGACYGVCRGAQFLTVLNGGQLIQHVTGHAGPHHALQTCDGQTIVATSSHHQMMAPGNTNHKLVAWTMESKSKFYLDGDNKNAIRLLEADMMLEPEIVWYPDTRSLAVQGHPEYCDDAHEFPKYCIKLIKQYIFGEK